MSATLLPSLTTAQSAKFEMRRYIPGLATGAGQANSGAGSQASTGTPDLALSTNLVVMDLVPTNTTQKRQVLVTNPGTGTLSFTAAPAVRGDSEFAANLTTCGSTLAAGSECLIEVSFSPTSVGSFTGVLAVTAAVANSPQEVTLAGTAFNPVSLASRTLPVGTVGQPYEFDFKEVLQVSNETSPVKSLATWTGTGTLPAGLSLDTATGILSGTPSASNAGALYTVTGTYKNNQGQRVYTIVINGIPYEVVSIAQGGMHACAATAAGLAYCWGYTNTSGSHGTGDYNSSLVPRQVVGLTNVVQVATGHDHSCARTSDGAVYCWGSGTAGQLGHGSYTGSNVPVAVPVLRSGVTHITAGANSTCAIHVGGAMCWGGNNLGQLGDGGTGGRASPGSVVGLSSGVTDIDTDIGLGTTCAVHNGAAKCWGYNNRGQVGDGSTTSRLTPTQVSGLATGVTSIDVGGSHVCAVHNGAVKCWGFNGSGQLGDGTTLSRSTPVSTLGISGTATKVGAANASSCALTTMGAMYCWGTANRLGNGSSTNSSTAILVPGLQGPVIGMAVGNFSNCAVESSGRAVCWGSANTSGTHSSAVSVPTATPILWPQ